MPKAAGIVDVALSSPAELRDRAVSYLKQTTVTYQTWVGNVAAGVYSPPDGSSTKWGLAFSTLDQIQDASPPPPPPPGVHWDVAFASRASQPSVKIVGGHDVEITGKTFSGYQGSDPVRPWAVRLEGCANVSLTDLDLDGAVSGISLVGCTGTLEIGWIRSRSLVGPDAKLIQLDGSTMVGRVHDVKSLGGLTSDVLSIYKSGGTDAANPLVLEDIAEEGTNWTNPQGGGLILGDGGGGHVVARRVTMLNPASCGAAIAGGVDNHITDCVIYGAQRTSSNIGLYVWNQSGQPSSGHEVARNKVFWKKADGTMNNQWDAGDSGTITGWSTNLWGAAAGIDPATLAVTA